MSEQPRRPHEIRKPPSAQVTAMQTQGEAPTYVRPSGPILAPGATLGKYKIHALLGRGGMGNVYSAEDPMIKRKVAIKLLAPEFARDAAFVNRLLTEAQAAGNLNHPNAVTVYSVEHVDDTYFIVMELVGGGSVEDYLARKGSPGWRAATRLIAEACKALAVAHGMGLIHRDIKPSNLMLTQDGHVKVADFGLAKLAATHETQSTQPGTILGTPSFMSPEQCRGGQIDARSDIYSLGCTYYMMLTGKQPFEAASSMQVMFAHCSAPIPDPRVLDADIPEACAQVLTRALAKNPDDRYDSAKSMLADLRAILGGGTITGAAPLGTSDAPPAPVDVDSLEALSYGGVLDSPAYVAPVKPIDRRIWIGAAVAAFAFALMIVWLTVGSNTGTATNDRVQANPPSPRVTSSRPPSDVDTPSPVVEPTAPVAVGTEPPVSATPGKLTATDARSAIVTNPATPTTERPPVEPEVVRPPVATPSTAAPAVAAPVVQAPVPPAEAAPGPPPLRQVVTNSIGQALAPIEPGTFVMGDDSLADAPQHEVTISKAFYMGITEVTQGEYTKVMGRIGMNRQPPDELPAAPVSWDQANLFCKKLSDLPAEKAAGRVYRLPTEAEWEYACRAGTATKFAFGDELRPDQANFGRKIDPAELRPPEERQPPPQRPQPGSRPPRQRPPSGPRQANEPQLAGAGARPLEPAGTFPPNAWGLHDMHGSVWEWCSDFYAINGYQATAAIDPTGPKAGKSRVARGGCWSSDADMCLSAFRNGKASFQLGVPTLGFRVVCEIAQ